MILNSQQHGIDLVLDTISTDVPLRFDADVDSDTETNFANDNRSSWGSSGNNANIGFTGGSSPLTHQKYISICTSDNKTFEMDSPNTLQRTSSKLFKNIQFKTFFRRYSRRQDMEKDIVARKNSFTLSGSPKQQQQVHEAISENWGEGGRLCRWGAPTPSEWARHILPSLTPDVIRNHLRKDSNNSTTVVAKQICTNIETPKSVAVDVSVAVSVAVVSNAEDTDSRSSSNSNRSAKRKSMRTNSRDSQEKDRLNMMLKGRRNSIDFDAEAEVNKCATEKLEPDAKALFRRSISYQDFMEMTKRKSVAFNFADKGFPGTKMESAGRQLSVAMLREADLQYSTRHKRTSVTFSGSPQKFTNSEIFMSMLEQQRASVRIEDNFLALQFLRVMELVKTPGNSEEIDSVLTSTGLNVNTKNKKKYCCFACYLLCF